MITLDEYIKSPCSLLSIPYWKQKTMSVPDEIKIVHDSEFSEQLLNSFSDEQYFRLSHNMKNIQTTELDFCKIITVSKKNISHIVSIINSSYTDIRVDDRYLKSLTKTPVYNPNLWIMATEKNTGKYFGCAIADYDPECRELIIEWVQVLPDYRGQRIGQMLVNELLYRMRETASFATVSGKVANNTHPEILYRKCGFTGNDIWHILHRKR